MLSVIEGCFASFFMIGKPFIFLTCLIPLARTSSIIFNRNGKKSYLCLVCDLRGKASKYSLLNMMLTMFFVYLLAFLFFCRCPLSH